MTQTDAKESISEVVLSLTGYEEIGIAKAFNTDVENLSSQKQPRAMAFVLFKREGLDHEAAYDACMKATQREVLEKFGVDVDELMADEPETEQGKESSDGSKAPKS